MSLLLRDLQPKTASVFAPLWTKPARYKGAYGGRGSGKSNDRAQAVILSMLTKPGYRVVCVREVQNSIKDSVKQLLVDWIDRLELRREFEVLETEIRGPRGSLCIFRGMNDQNNDTIKSLEGYDVAWWEEAQTASERSLRLLRPTLRKPGSELWFTWNPRYRTDPVDILLRADKPEDAVVVEANFEDNPWFPDVLKLERKLDEGTEHYAHTWLGDYEKVGDRQFIPAGIVREAMEFEAETYRQDELILGVDVARFGSDETVIAVRKGRDANSEPWKIYQGLDTMEVAARVAFEMDRLFPDAVMIDVGGLGAGVYDRLRQLGREVIAVDSSRRADGLTRVKTANKRAEMWQRLKEWLEQGSVAIPKDSKLESQLTNVEYTHDRNNAILLEKKDAPRRTKLGLPSPDRADALALTFAYPVSKLGALDWERDVEPVGRSEVTGY